MTVALALVLQLAQQTAAPPPASPTNASPQVAVPAPTPDPATSQFATDAGILLVIVKTPLVADYEQTIRTLQEALVKTADPQRQAVAKGWRVFKAAEGDAKGNTVYVHLLFPATPGFDYRVSLLVDEMVKDLAPDLLSKYRDSLAGPPSKLTLTEFAHMSVAPVAPAPPPSAAPPPKKPGGR